MGTKTIEYWGWPIAEPKGDKVNLYWKGLTLLALLVFVLLILFPLYFWAQVIVVSLLMVYAFCRPIFYGLPKRAYDVKVYENGVVLFFPWREPLFHPWERFRGFSYTRTWKGPETMNRVMVLHLKDEDTYDDPSSVQIGWNLKDPKPAWDLIKGRMSRVEW